MTSAGTNRGFTLIEVVLTIVVISIGLVAMMLLFDNVTHNAMQSDMNMTATYLARERLEIIAFDKVYSGYDSIKNARYGTSENVNVGGKNYIRELNIYEVNKFDLITAEQGSNFKRVDVTVKWGNEGSQKITETTLFTR